MPPLARYWFAYLLVLVALGTLAALGWFLFLNAGSLHQNPTALFIYGGVWVAVLSFTASTWSQWKTASIQHAMGSLQALRTDKEYLINSGMVTARTAVGTPLSETEVETLLAERVEPYEVSKPNFGQAAVFVLNQYEFIAAAAMAGAMDRHLLRQTIRGVVIRLVTVFAPLIRRLRAENPSTFRNLVLLYRAFAPRRGRPDLGP
jgi:hypothetical protein